MSAQNLSALTAALVQHGHLPPDTAPPPEAPPTRPWFIALLLGIAGWLAGLCSVFFLALVFEPKTAGSLGMIGVVLLAVAFGLYVADRNNSFLDQLALAFSIAGQLAVAGAIGQATEWKPALTASLIAILQGVLVLAMPNSLARLLSTMFACAAWAIAIRTGWLSGGWFGSARASVGFLPALLAWLVIWTPVAAAAWFLIAREAAWMATAFRTLARPVLSGLLIALAFGSLATAPWEMFDDFGPAGARRMNWLVIWPLLSAAGAMLAGFLAYRLRHTGLIGAAAVAAFLHAVMFYYLLGSTLLTKAAIMAVAGVVMLAIGGMLWRAPSLQAREAT
jgi:Domain of unknown function (DUF4401)